jgi:lysophospholipase L1-like esterase
MTLRSSITAVALALISSAQLGCMMDTLDPEEGAEDAEEIADAESELQVECRIQPFGDSLTAGVPPLNSLWNSGYRDDLVIAPPAVGAPIRFVGTQNAYSTAGMFTLGQQYHSGYPGWTADALVSQIPSNLVAPNVILLHAGTNDIVNFQGHLNAAYDLNVLVRSLLFYNPTARILVAKIIPLAGAYAAAGLNDEVVAFNVHVDALVAQLNLEGWTKVHVVDMYTGFPTWTLADGIHPVDVGYAWMADRWREKLNVVGCF